MMKKQIDLRASRLKDDDTSKPNRHGLQKERPILEIMEEIRAELIAKPRP